MDNRTTEPTSTSTFFEDAEFPPLEGGGLILSNFTGTRFDIHNMNIVLGDNVELIDCTYTNCQISTVKSGRLVKWARKVEEWLNK